jgi:hypothetical protein
MCLLVAHAATRLQRHLPQDRLRATRQHLNFNTFQRLHLHHSTTLNPIGQGQEHHFARVEARSKPCSPKVPLALSACLVNVPRAEDLVWTVLPWANGADELVEAAGFVVCCDVVAEGGGVIVGVTHGDGGASGV